jgi:hypothetical protein
VKGNQTTSDEANHDPKEDYAEAERDQRADGRGRRLPPATGCIGGAGVLEADMSEALGAQKGGNGPRDEWGYRRGYYMRGPQSIAFSTSAA